MYWHDDIYAAYRKTQDRVYLRLLLKRLSVLHTFKPLNFKPRCGKCIACTQYQLTA